jgi:hypothetical protein
VIAIATTGSKDRAFSDDTGIADALVLAVKRGKPVEASPDASPTLFVNLVRRPEVTTEAVDIARVIRNIPDDESGFIRAGDEQIGSFIRSTLAGGGCAAVREPAVAASASSIQEGSLRLPFLSAPIVVPTTAIANVGSRGEHDMQISGKANGPFDIKSPFGPDSRYPTLWAHDADRERRLIVEPDRFGEVREGMEDKAKEIWATATRLHFNRDFQLNSQSLVACFTPELAVGGRAWPNFRVEGDPRREKALGLWANTTLGLINFWWIAGRQQQGRAIVTITQLPRLTALDVTTLDDKQLKKAERLFAEVAERDFLPANEAYRDETRQNLDRAMLCDLLGLPESILGPLAALRHQWCEEPSVHGGKSTRPGGGG